MSYQYKKLRNVRKKLIKYKTFVNSKLHRQPIFLIKKLLNNLKKNKQVVAIEKINKKKRNFSRQKYVFFKELTLILRHI